MAERMNEKPWLKLVIPRVCGARWDAMVKNRELHWKLPKDKARRRMEKGGKLDDRDDFFGHMIMKEEIAKRSFEGNGQTLIVAGSETMTSALAGTVWYLLANPACVAEMRRKIRGAFKLTEEITCDSKTKLVFSYDLDLAPRDITSWNDICRCFGLWKKPALMVKLIPREAG